MNNGQPKYHCVCLTTYWHARSDVINYLARLRRNQLLASYNPIINQLADTPSPCSCSATNTLCIPPTLILILLQHSWFSVTVLPSVWFNRGIMVQLIEGPHVIFGAYYDANLCFAVKCLPIIPVKSFFPIVTKLVFEKLFQI